MEKYKKNELIGIYFERDFKSFKKGKLFNFSNDILIQNKNNLENINNILSFNNISNTTFKEKGKSYPNIFINLKAFIGNNGAGKTTLLDLVNLFYSYKGDFFKIEKSFRGLKIDNNIELYKIEKYPSIIFLVKKNCDSKTIKLNYDSIRKSQDISSFIEGPESNFKYLTKKIICDLLEITKSEDKIKLVIKTKPYISSLKLVKSTFKRELYFLIGFFYIWGFYVNNSNINFDKKLIKFLNTLFSDASFGFQEEEKTIFINDIKHILNETFLKIDNINFIHNLHCLYFMNIFGNTKNRNILKELLLLIEDDEIIQYLSNNHVNAINKYVGKAGGLLGKKNLISFETKEFYSRLTKGYSPKEFYGKENSFVYNEKENYTGAKNPIFKATNKLEIIYKIDDIIRQYNKKENFFRSYYDDFINILNHHEVEKYKYLRSNLFKFNPLLSFDIEFLADDLKTFLVSELSSGQTNMIGIFNLLKKSLSNGNKNNQVLNIIIDEPEISLHLEWQRQFIYNLIHSIYSFLEFDTIEQSAIPNVYINILIATHSPFIIADLPKENIIFLKKDSNGMTDLLNFEDISKNLSIQNTFLGNIPELIKGGFFLDGLYGYLGERYIEKLVENKDLKGIAELNNFAGDKFILEYLLLKSINKND